MHRQRIPIDVIRVHDRIMVVGGEDAAGHHHQSSGDHVHPAGHEPPGPAPGSQERR